MYRDTAQYTAKQRSTTKCTTHAKLHKQQHNKAATNKAGQARTTTIDRQNTVQTRRARSKQTNTRLRQTSKVKLPALLYHQPQWKIAAVHIAKPLGTAARDLRGYNRRGCRYPWVNKPGLGGAPVLQKAPDPHHSKLQGVH